MSLGAPKCYHGTSPQHLFSKWGWSQYDKVEYTLLCHTSIQILHWKSDIWCHTTIPKMSTWPTDYCFWGSLLPILPAPPAPPSPCVIRVCTVSRTEINMYKPLTVIRFFGVHTDPAKQFFRHNLQQDRVLVIWSAFTFIPTVIFYCTTTVHSKRNTYLIPYFFVQKFIWSIM